MKTLRLGKVVVASLVLSVCVLEAPAAVYEEPDSNPTSRALRTDYVKTWYIFNDSKLDGILNPGDTMIATFKNWWTPVSAHTQHNYDQGPYGAGKFWYNPGDDMSSGPMNFATKTNSNTSNYWLDQESYALDDAASKKNTVRFYMTYSQYDNNDFSTYCDTGGGKMPDGDLKTLIKDRNMYRNGYAMGWITNRTEKDGATYLNDQSADGHVEMSFYVHEGRSPNLVAGDTIAGFGQSYSNPQVSMSNDISYDAKHDGDGPGGNSPQWHPPNFDEATKTYNPATAGNVAYMATLDNPGASFGGIVSSMEVREYDPHALPGLGWLTRTPTDIEQAGGPKDHNGNTYLYEDAFIDKSTYAKSATDGGVIAGLRGMDNYNPVVNNFGDQQVIRIDVSPDMLKQGAGDTYGNIDAIVFYDFGSSIPGASGTQQTSPKEIWFGVDLTRSVADGQIYYEDPLTLLRTYFVENRIYIARVEVAPEPATVGLLLMGGAILLARKRRRNG